MQILTQPFEPRGRLTTLVVLLRQADTRTAYDVEAVALKRCKQIPVAICDDETVFVALLQLFAKLLDMERGIAKVRKPCQRCNRFDNRKHLAFLSLIGNGTAEESQSVLRELRD